jgi:UDP-N-acetylglucosamine 1-carboxyvinyltransferase
MDQFRIDGPCRIAGRVEVAGAKNAALPEMAAALLTEEPVELLGLPRLRDVRTLGRLLGHLGVESAELEDGALELHSRSEPSVDDAPYELVKTMRASVLVLGPLVARLGRARVSLPGGCAIGVRPIDQHLAGLEALGATIELEHGYVTAHADQLRGGGFRFGVRTVGGTENLMLAASLARGTTVLDNCAREPEIVDLARLLTAMGAHIDGAGSDRIIIEGVDRLGGARHRVIPDRIEAGTYLLAAAATGGTLEVAGAVAADLAPLVEKLAGAGCDVAPCDGGLRLERAGELGRCDVSTAPHPGFPTDLQAQFMVLMTQAQGVSTMRETVFENRFQHVPELARMGADIHLDERTARVNGPTPLSGARVMATDLRASASLVLAGLVARGQTVIDRIYHLDRGYERMELKLQTLGARVERESTS